jgi:uncharacterized membrane protein
MPILGAFIARPRLLIPIGLGIAAYAALRLASPIGWITAAVIAWDVVCVGFIALIMPILMGARDPKSIRANAEDQDQGQGVILGLAIIAGAASIVAVAAELSVAKNVHGLEKAARVLLPFVTVACSWAFVQLVFALHYAHEYYGPTATKKNAAGGGLRFPGDEAPDYWDFVHFSIVIGAACQTADVQFTDKAMRRIGGVHGVFAFVYNTGVMALTINLLAGLLQ